MAESKAASVVFTNGSYLAGQAQTTAENARSLANEAQTTADGKNKIYRGSSIEDTPKSGVVVGDLFFSSNDIYRYDGTSWEQVVSDTTGEETRAEVEKATSEAKDYSDSVKAQLEADAAKAQATADSITNFVQNSSGSSYLATLLNQSPSNASLSALVNGQVVSAINVSSSGDTLIAGKKIMLDGDVTINGTAFASKLKATGITVDQLVAGAIDASKIKVINLDANSITTGTLNGVNITGSTFIASSANTNVSGTVWNNYNVTVNNTGLEVHGGYTLGSTEYEVEANITADDIYLEKSESQTDSDSSNGTKSIDINVGGPDPYIKLITDGPTSGLYKSTYVGSDAITTKSLQSDSLQADNALIGNWKIQDNRVYAQWGTVYVANRAGSNFDSNGSAGFQVWAGIGLGKNTIYTPSNNLYIQQGQGNPALSQSYSEAGKVSVNCNKVISQVANTVVSRLSVKTAITQVDYDRALMAVQNTDMYDYQYINDDSGQHYVSGIIDDVHATPEYKMDDMLINKERTARIDANLIGYHHVVLQKLLERVDALEHQINKA